MKNGLKMKLKKKKKKKKTSPAPLSAQTAQRPVGQHPRWPTSPPLLFLFPRDADAWAPHVSLPFPLSFLLPSLAAQLTRRRRAIPAAPGRLPTFPSSLRSQLRQSNPP
jgi:hypothetical protein